MASLLSAKIKFKMTPLFRNCLRPYLTCCFNYSKILSHSKLDSLEAKGNHLADICTRNAALEGTNSQTSVTVQRDISPNDKLENWLEKPNNWL